MRKRLSLISFPSEIKLTCVYDMIECKLICYFGLHKLDMIEAKDKNNVF